MDITNYIFTSYVHYNGSNNNDSNNNNTNTCCINKVCKMTRNGHNAADPRLLQLMTKLSVLLMVNVVLIWIFVGNIFKLSIYAVVSFELVLFELVLFDLVLVNLCLWLTFNYNKQTLYFDYVKG